MRRRNQIMALILLAIFACFSAAMGYELAGNKIGVWGLIAFILTSIIALQLGYFLNLLMEG